jgi:hypothetical protein
MMEDEGDDIVAISADVADLAEKVSIPANLRVNTLEATKATTGKIKELSQ